jgi:hypothetical protein
MKLRRGLLVTLAVVAGTALLVAPAAGAGKGKKKKGGIFKVVSTTSNSPGAVSPGVLSATAFCPSGKAVSGGFDVLGVTPGSISPEVTESSRVGQSGWRASFVPTNEGQSILAEVYCAKLKGSVTTAAGSQQLGTSASSTANPIATCPRNRQLISGGFQNALGSPPVPTAFATQNRLIAKNVWQAGFIRLSPATGSADQLTAYAYCFKPPKPKKKSGAKRKVLPRFLTELSATGQAPATGGAEATLTTQACPGKRRGVAGGFLTPLSFDSVPAVQQARFVNGVWNLRVRQVVSAAIATSFEAKEYCG